MTSIDNVQKTSSPLEATDAAAVPPPDSEAQKPIIPEVISEAPAEPIVSAPPEPVVSPPPELPLPPGQSVVKREEKVEYRDQDGNILNEAQVKELEGKVSFKTRYETRTRLIDINGNEIPSPGDAAPVAPPHPDAEGIDSSTIAKAEDPSKPNVQADESKEESIAKSDTGVAKPASEGNEATAAAQ